MGFSSPEHARLALATSGWGFAAGEISPQHPLAREIPLGGIACASKERLDLGGGMFRTTGGLPEFRPRATEPWTRTFFHQRKSVMNASTIVQASHPARRERAEKPQSEDPSTVSRRHYQKPRNRHFRSHVLLGSRNTLGQLYSKASRMSVRRVCAPLELVIEAIERAACFRLS